MTSRILAALLTTTLSAGLPLMANAQDQDAEKAPEQDIPELAEDVEQKLEESENNPSDEIQLPSTPKVVDYYFSTLPNEWVGEFSQ